MYGISKGNYAKRVGEDTQLYQIIHVDDKSLQYEAYEATGKLYDKFTLEKREGLPNLLLEALPQENRK
jgi:homoaconitase/3-isopropylmalate dehydratase large subunit